MKNRIKFLNKYNSEKMLIIIVSIGYSLIFIIPMLLCDDFFTDWFRSEWIVQYYADYFRENHCFPNVINSYGISKYVSQVGMMHPIYYGKILYKILGFMGFVFSSAKKAITLVSMIVVFIQSFFWNFLLIKRTQNKVLSFITVFLLVFSIFNISSFYISNTIPQWFAVSFVSIAVANWMISFTTNNKCLYWVISAISIALAAGSHPITVALGGLFFGCIVLTKLIAERKKITTKEWMFGSCLMLLVILTMSSWLYATVTVKTRVSIAGNLAYDSDLDSLFNRLFPIPFCFETTVQGANNCFCPFRTYQISTPLMIVLISAVIHNFKHRKKVVKSAILLGCYLIILGISCVEVLGRVLPSIVGIIQFPSRLIYYVDILAVVMIVTLYDTDKDNEAQSTGGLIVDEKCKSHNIPLFLLGIGVSALVVNFVNIKAVEGVVSYDNSHHLLLSSAFYNADDYTSLSQFGEEIEVDETKTEYSDLREYKYPVYMFDVQSNGFGNPTVNQINVSRDSYIGINMYQHPWNSLYIDGDRIDNMELHPDEYHQFAFIKLCEGIHSAEYRFEPPKAWLVFENVSYLSYGVLIILLIIMSIRKMRTFKK